MKYFKLKFLLLFFTLAAALPPAWAETVTDVITVDGLADSYNGYTSFSGKTFSSSAVYAGICAKNKTAIQLNTSKTSGIITTASGGRAKSVKITFSSTNTKSVKVYGKNTPYNEANDLTDASTYGTVLYTIGNYYSGNTYEIEGDYSYIAVGPNSGAVYIDQIEIVWETEGGSTVEQVATPTFSVAGGNYTEAQNVEISCETAGASIYYTLDGSDPTAESTPYAGAITISQTTTLKAIAVKDGMDDSYVATATYTFPMIVTDLAQANRLAEGTEFVYNGYAVVTYVVDSEQYGNADVWIRDNLGNAAYLYRATPTGLAQGAVLTPGWSATRVDFKGLKELSNPAVQSTQTVEVKPELVTEITDGDVSKYVRLENVTEVAGWYDKFGTGSLEAGKTYNVEGIVGYYNSLQFWPTLIEEVTAPITELAITLDKTSGEFTVGDEVVVTVTVENAVGDCVVTYKINDGTEQDYDATTGIIIPNDQAGTVNLTVIAMDERMEPIEATGSYTFTAAPEPFDGCPAVITFKDAEDGKDSSAAFGSDFDAFTASISGDGAKYIESITSDKVYQGITGLKFSSSKQGGVLNLMLKDMGEGYWRTSKIIVNAKKWGSDNASMSVNGSDGVNLTDEWADYEFPMNSSVLNAVVIGAIKRMYVRSITIVHQCGEEPMPELSVALEPAEKTYTVGNEAKVMVNVENGNEDTMVTYKINGGADQDYDAATGIVLPNNKAMKYTVEVNATDGEREATATGTYSFTAAPAFDVTLTPNKEGNYTVGDEAVVTVAVDKYIGEEYIVTYTIGDSEEQIEYNAETGIVLPNDKAGDVTVKVYVTDGYDHEEKEYAATYHFDAAPAIVVTLTPASGNYYIGEQVTVTVATENTIGDYDVTYKIGEGEEFNYEDGIIITSDQEGTINLTVNVADGYHDGVATASGVYTFAPRPVVATPELSLVSGSYTGAQTLNLTCATDGATISYSTDGGETWTTGNTVNVDQDMNIIVKAEKDGMTASTTTAYYIIDIPAKLPTIEPLTGYYSIMNNGNGKYVNVAGRKTVTFAASPDKMAGTVIRVETNDKGQVQSLRSQGADLQGYANRAMKYVPEVVQLIVDKLHAEGDGNILGDEGLDAIMEKFNTSFDHHLYVEQAEGGYRLYGKTPSMQPVVDFYRENKAKVEAKLPQLEAFVNSAIDKVLDKTQGKGKSILQPFSLHDTWARMDGNLTEPVDEATTMEFYREVLNDKNHVWDFAYQTAMTYWERVKNHPRYEELKEKMGEMANNIDKIEQVRPDFKYYVVQKDGKIDYISQGNKDLNAARSLWTLTPRESFTVAVPADNLVNDKYVATLYTDFAYDLPAGVTAYKVTGVSPLGAATTEALTGTIPAQTPVLLKANAAGDLTLTLNTADGTAPADNLLVGGDYFIKQYGINTPQVEGAFNLVKELLGESVYNYCIEEYGHLLLKTAGTVNNKYLWGLSTSDLEQCTYGEDGDCEVRTLSTGDKGVGFYMTWTAPANQAFLASKEFNPITLTSKGDIDRDGDVDIDDLTALIDILMGADTPENNYDYEAADFDEDGSRQVSDISSLIDYLLVMNHNN